jgi:hypothetical protein
MSLSEIEKCRRKRKFRYELTKELEFDKTKLAYYKIQRFCKKKLFPTPINLDSCKIESGIYKFHCNAYYIDKSISTIFPEIETIEKLLSEKYDDDSITTSLELALETEYDKIIEHLKDTVPIVLDLRKHESKYLVYNEKLYRLDKKTRKRFISQYMKIKPDTHSCDLFLQIINYSKALCDTYNS